MKRRTVARLIAVLLIAYAFAFAIVQSDRSDMLRYRTLGRDALLAELAKSNDANFDESFFIGVFLVGAVMVTVDGVGALVLLAMNKISPVSAPATSDDDGEGSGASRFH